MKSTIEKALLKQRQIEANKKPQKHSSSVIESAANTHGDKPNTRSKIEPKLRIPASDQSSLQENPHYQRPERLEAIPSQNRSSNTKVSFENVVENTTNQLSQTETANKKVTRPVNEVIQTLDESASAPSEGFKKQPAGVDNDIHRKSTETRATVEPIKDVDVRTEDSDIQNDKFQKSVGNEAPRIDTQKNDAIDFQDDVSDEVLSSNSDKNKLTLNLAKLEEIGFVTSTDRRRLINEEFREIKRKLLNSAFGPLSSTLKNPNIIMVTSARPSEGKTFTSINLALSIAAEKDKKVLLVEADVLKPNVLRTLNIKPALGLMDYLQGDTPLSDYIYETNVENLRIIPAGSSHHLSTELLASNVMKETVNEFSNRYPDRIVIFDTPPILGINESAILASFAGQAVVIVEEGRSKLTDINSSMERLSDELAIGFVINKTVNISRSDGYYGKYGYYGYHNYGHE